MSLKITQLFIYPLKGARPISVESVNMLRGNLEFDRKFMLIDADSTLINQKRMPMLATFETSLANGFLRIESSSASEISIPLHAITGPKISAKLHFSEISVAEISIETSLWFTQQLRVECKLVVAATEYTRNLPKHAPRAMETPPTSGFGDLAPIMIANEQSLIDLNSNTSLQFEMSQFRPNVVIDGLSPWGEDSVTSLKNSMLCLRRNGPCERCAVINTDQSTGEVNRRYLSNLSKIRMKEKVVSSGIWFGAYFSTTDSGTLNVGDVLEAQ